MHFRYQRRKQNGHVKKTADLTLKQHEKKKKQWRENSARHYAKKKSLNAILNLTPPSINKPDAVQLHLQDVQVAPSPTHLPIKCPTQVQTSTQKAGRKRKATITSLRSKLRETKDKLAIKARENKNLPKKLKMLQEKKTASSTNQMKANQKGANHLKYRKTLPINSQRRLMGRLASGFLHLDENSTIINGKTGETRKKGQVFRKRALNDTMERLHAKFISQHPRQKLSRAQFCRLKPFWIVKPNISQRDPCACKTHEHFSFKIKKLDQLGIVATLSTTDLVESCVCSTSNIECMYRRCGKCKDKIFPTVIDPSTKGNIISWEEWVSRTVTIFKKGKDGPQEETNVKNTFLKKKHTSIEKLVDLSQEHIGNLQFMYITSTTNFRG